MRKPKSDYVIQTVSNALQLLEVFQGEDELGVTELSRRLSLHKNNVFRLLATLEEKGYIDQSPNSDRYRLGVRCLELGQSFSQGRDLLRRARPILEGLSIETQETSHLAVLQEFEVVHLDGVASRQMVLSGLRTGLRLPAHCTALGKVLLGCGDDELRQAFDRAVVSSGRLASRTEATITDRDKLFEHLNGVRVQGFGLDVEECEAGLHCAAAPVHDANGRIVAALSVSAPSLRVDQEKLVGGLAPAAVRFADRLSEQLGGVA